MEWHFSFHFIRRRLSYCDYDVLYLLLKANLLFINEIRFILLLIDEEYLTELEKKLDEEVREYHEDKNLVEMADILEVLYAICEARGYSLT